MANFEIRVINRETARNEGFVQLEFSSNIQQKLTIKDVRFYPNHTQEKKTTIDTVFLGEKAKIRTFTFGNDKEYERLEFLIKQEGTKGWIVSIDLKSDMPPKIEESPFQVL